MDWLVGTGIFKLLFELSLMSSIVNVAKLVVPLVGDIEKLYMSPFL